MSKSFVYVLFVGAALVAALFAVVLWPTYEPQDFSERIMKEQEAMWREMSVSAEPTGPDVADTPEIVPTNVAVAGDTPILVYHSVITTTPKSVFEVTVDAFESQMRYLHDNAYNVIKFGDLMNALANGDFVKPKTVVITFDDGWENQYENAVPILDKYGFTATFFVFTNPIGRDKRFMTWEQLRGMQDSGLTIESHSRTHPFLHKMKDAAAMAGEVAGSKTTLESELGAAVEYFAYPFGVVTPEEIKAVQAAGYKAARAFPGGTHNTADDMFQLKSVAATENMRDFAAIFRVRAPAQAN